MISSFSFPFEFCFEDFVEEVDEEEEFDGGFDCDKFCEFSLNEVIIEFFGGGYFKPMFVYNL